MPSAAQLTSGTFAPTNFDPVGDVDGLLLPRPLLVLTAHRSVRSSEPTRMERGVFT